MNDQPTPTHNAVRRFAPVLLLASFGLNLFFAGWLAGSGFRGHPPPPMDGRFGMLEHQLEGRLSPEGMAKVGALLHDIDTGMRSQFDAGESLRRQLHALLTAEQFNGDDFVHAVDALNVGRAKFDNNVARRVAEVMAGLSARDRAIFADAVLSMPPGPLG
jgi:uncharacterized membrane protein